MGMNGRSRCAWSRRRTAWVNAARRAASERRRVIGYHELTAATVGGARLMLGSAAMTSDVKLAPAVPTPGRTGFPPQIQFIVGNEAAERYSFYGMRSILTLFMTQYLLFQEAQAEFTYHLFVMAVYFTPLLGAYISDRFWGKYRTIMTLSLVYVAGHAVLAMWENQAGLFAGLGLIALGAGGIKPCVAAHVGDQFSRSNKHLLAKVFNLFYFSINVGSFLATLITPWTRHAFGPSVAFGIPGVLMAVATFVFWLGRKQYVHVPPTRRDDTPGRVMVHALLRGGFGAARQRFGDQAVDDTRAVLRVARVMFPVFMFWALFDQTGSTWVLLTQDMNLHGFLEPDMLQAANPILVMGMIPLFTLVVYPQLERRGRDTGALARMRVGMFVTAASFGVVALIRVLLDAGVHLSAFWMIVPYFVLTAGEILVSITGLEFAYTQAPRSVKSTVMGIWYMVIAVGNLMTAVVSKLNPFDGAAQFGFWAGAMAVVGVAFVVNSRGYQTQEYVEDDVVR